MERLIIVVDCPDDWRGRVHPDDVAGAIEAGLVRTPDHEVPRVRARWQSLDTEGV